MFSNGLVLAIRTVARTILDPRIILGLLICALALAGILARLSAGSLADALENSAAFELYTVYLRDPMFNLLSGLTGFEVPVLARDAAILYIAFSAAVVGAVSVLQARDRRLWLETEREAQLFLERYPNFDWERAERHLVESVGEELEEYVPPQFPTAYPIWHSERPWYYRIYPSWPGLNYVVGLIVGVVTIPFIVFGGAVRLYRSQELVSEPGAYSVIYAPEDQLFGLRISIITQIVLLVALIYLGDLAFGVAG